MMLKKHAWLLAIVALAFFNLGQDDDDGGDCSPQPFLLLPSSVTLDPRLVGTQTETLSVLNHEEKLTMTHTCSACCDVSLSGTIITVSFVRSVPSGTECVITAADTGYNYPWTSITASATVTVLQKPLSSVMYDKDYRDAGDARPTNSLIVGDVRRLETRRGIQPYITMLVSGNSVTLDSSQGWPVITAVQPGDSVVVVCDSGVPADCDYYMFQVKAK